MFAIEFQTEARPIRTIFRCSTFVQAVTRVFGNSNEKEKKPATNFSQLRTLINKILAMFSLNFRLKWLYCTVSIPGMFAFPHRIKNDFEKLIIAIRCAMLGVWMFRVLIVVPWIQPHVLNQLHRFLKCNIFVVIHSRRVLLFFFWFFALKFHFSLFFNDRSQPALHARNS